MQGILLYLYQVLNTVLSVCVIQKNNDSCPHGANILGQSQELLTIILNRGLQSVVCGHPWEHKILSVNKQGQNYCHNTTKMLLDFFQCSQSH